MKQMKQPTHEFLDPEKSNQGFPCVPLCPLWLSF